MVQSAPDFMNEPKKWMNLNKKQLLGLGLGFFITLGLLVSGYYTWIGGLWMIVLPAILYLFPHLFGMKDSKIMAVHGAVFIVVTLLIGVFYSAPALIENRDKFVDSGMYSDADIIVTGTGYTITVTYTGDDFSYAPMVQITETYGVGFYTYYGAEGGTRDIPGTLSTSGDITFDIPADDSLYTIAMYMKDGDGKVVSESVTNTIFLTEMTSDANINRAVLTGVVYTLVFIAILFFMILFFTYIIRSKANKTRTRMIEQGRLYPDGYGRCKECDAIVLPGEINCRKCGAYIDVPKEFRPNKVDFFECENCGAEVPEDAEVCPKCGVTFSETEVEVLHADGTVEVVESTFGCPSCGAEIPIVSEICPKCGKMFRK